MLSIFGNMVNNIEAKCRSSDIQSYILSENSLKPMGSNYKTKLENILSVEDMTKDSSVINLYFTARKIIYSIFNCLYEDN
jgi:hypothetical protein